MITRLSAGDLDNYAKLKEFILAQHKLSSKDYRQRFTQAMRDPNETNVAYVSRTEAEKGHAQIKKIVTRAHELYLVRTSYNNI